MKKLSHLLSLSCAVLIPLFTARPAAAAPGGLDLTFSGDGKHVANFGGKDGGHAVVQQPDGKLVVVGKSASQVLVARYTVAGALDSTFGTGGVVKTTVDTTLGTTAAAFAVKCLPGGKLLVGGRTGSMDSRDFMVIRYHANGSLDTTFGGGDGIAIADFGGDDFFNDMDVAPVSGKILLTGSTDVGGDLDFAIACFNADGTPDNDFDADGELVKDFAGLDLGDAARCVAALPGGDFILAGYTGNGIDNDFALLRYNADGTPDTGFGGMGAGWEQVEMGGIDAIGTMCLDQNGMLVVVGSSTVSSMYHVAIARLNPADGGLDTTFSTDGKLVDDSLGSMSDAWAVAAQPGGEIVLAGFVDSEAYMLFRYLSNGTLDTGFGTNGKVTETFGPVPPNNGAEISDVLVQGNGQILAVGTVYKDGDLDDVALARFQSTTLPDIAVEQPSPTLLEDGFSTVAYGGPLPATVPVTKTFTIRNTGLAPLNLNATPVTVTGTNAADFVITQPANTPLAPGLTRTFTVKLAPLTGGLKTAALHVASDDADEGAYDIALTANVASFPVGFELPGYVVVEGSSVTLKVKRQAAGVSVTVDVKSASTGTVTAGSDYTAINTTKTFADGSAEETVTFTALTDGLAEGTENVTVTLSGGTAPKGAAATLTTTVRIIDINALTPGNGAGQDKAFPPVPIVSTPAGNGLVPVVTGGTVTITGTATDALAVKDVEVSIDNFATFSPATLTAPGAASTAYTATVVPVGGSATAPFSIRVRTRDYANQETTTPLAPARTFRVSRPLLVSAGAGGTVAAGFAPSSFREPGTSVTITATPAAGKVFDRWLTTGTGPVSGLDFSDPANYGVIGITEGSRELSGLTFRMQEGLTLQATFLDNPFTAVAGIYNGLVTTDAAATITGGGLTAPGNHTEGFFTLTLMTSGAFSGKISVDGLDLNVAGVFDADLDARFGTTRAKTVSVLRPGKPALVVALKLAPGSGSNTDDAITGTVVQNYRTAITARSIIVAMKKYYTGTAPFQMPVEFLASSTSPADGRITAYFEMKDFPSQPPALLSEMYYPQGHGYISMTVSKAGLCTYSGRLADNTIIGGSMTATRSGTNLFAPLHIPLYAKQGCFICWLGFDADTGVMEDTSAVRWFRPYQDVQHYPDGWVEGLVLDVKGAVYKAETGNSVIDGTTAPTRTGTVDFSWGLVPVTITKAFSATNADVVTDADPIYSTTITRTTGVITGNFSHTDGTTTTTQPYYGVIYQKGTLPGPRGFGYFMSPTPVVKTYLGETGKVELKLD